MRSLETTVRANLKCQVVGLAIQLDPQKVPPALSPADMDPGGPRYDVTSAVESSYRMDAEASYVRYHGATSGQLVSPQPGDSKLQGREDSKARQKVLDVLRSSPGVSEVGNLFLQDPFMNIYPRDAFSPIFFVYSPTPGPRVPPGSPGAVISRFYLAYNGRFLMAAGFCEPDQEMIGVSSAASEVRLLMGKSGYDFHWLSPMFAVRAIDVGVAAVSATPTSAVLNDSVGVGGARTNVLTNLPRGVSNVLRSLYSDALAPLLALCDLREQSNTAEALMKTVEAHRNTVLDLLTEYNRSRWYELPKKFKLRRLLRAHCLNLTEKAGRVDALSESIGRGIDSVDANLQLDPRLRAAMEADPDWKLSLHHNFVTEPVLELVARTSQEISGHGFPLPPVWLAVLAAAVGGLVGYLAGLML